MSDQPTFRNIPIQHVPRLDAGYYPGNCDCITWACTDMERLEAGNGHNPACEKYERRKPIFRLPTPSGPTPHFDGRDLDNGCMVSFDVGDATKSDLADQCVDLVFGSPPYLKARTYGIGAQRGMNEWLELMIAATREGLRVSRGLVIWVIAGTTKGACYTPAPEGLMYTAWRAGIQLYRPACWHKVDPTTGGGSGGPGSGGKQWLRSDWEYVIAFKPKGKLPWADPVFQRRLCKYQPGGKIRTRQEDGSRDPRDYKNPKYANPGNVVKARVGGGHMGDKELYENEAPFPEGLPAFFIQGWCPPKGWVYDPFSGSGTTAVMAGYHGRNGFGTDLRLNQVELSVKRLVRRIREGRACAVPAPPSV